MEIYGGQCHCRAIRFEVRTELKDLVRCNCSLCIRRSAVMHYVDPADFRLLGGEDHLVTYRFGTRTTAHHFCKVCGVFPFFRSNWDGKEHYAINVACLDGVDPYEQTTRLIDGRSF
jgi:hypothetical protein